MVLASNALQMLMSVLSELIKEILPSTTAYSYYCHTQTKGKTGPYDGQSLSWPSSISRHPQGWYDRLKYLHYKFVWCAGVPINDFYSCRWGISLLCLRMLYMVVLPPMTLATYVCNVTLKHLSLNPREVIFVHLNIAKCSEGPWIFFLCGILILCELGAMQTPSPYLCQ